MENATVIFYFLIISITAGIFSTWIYLLFFIIKSLRESPKLGQIKNIKNTFPRVSIIVPARNEETYLHKCVESLVNQDYPDFEIVLVNDESSDKTFDIMNEFKNSNSIIKVVNVNQPGGDWIGKNWACYQGYMKSNGNLLLFTDADSYHAENTLSLAVQNINHNKLDALTIIPRLICNDFITKVTLPILFTFLHTRFSPLKVNDIKSKLGYFFGSYFIIWRDTYEKVGSHAAVKHEFIEDGALGKKVKEENFKIKMLRGENYVQAIWARNYSELFKSLDRLIIPLFLENRITLTLLGIALFFLLLFPFVMFFLSLTLSVIHPFAVGFIVLILTGSTLFLLLLTNSIQLRKTLYLNQIYSLGIILGATIIVSRFFSKLLIPNSKTSVNWRDRVYKIPSNETSVL
ncbi:MAG TPA: glycosyltransferase [Nitrososphaeraceae archaeon]|nr:glycosyltransferase [Nitrososphaeraceae archaeon]